MKKYLSIIVGLMLVIGASPALAANDLTLQTSTVISAGTTFTVTGDYTMDSITVNADSFNVTLSPGGSLIITAPGGTPISASASDGITTDRVCSSAESRMQLVAKSTAGAEIITISATGSCGGSSGGTPNVPITPVVTTPVVTTPVVTTPVVTTPVVTLVQLPVQASPVAVAATSAASAAHIFRTALRFGSRGIDVTELQNRLITEGLMSGSATGYFGALTQVAVKKYQANHGIDQLGNVGPATRAALNSAVSMVATPTTATTAMPTASVSALTSAQSSSIIQLLQAFGADASVIANVKASLGIPSY
jgi:peptidoglycan hydrolase-like protein with peptidoglycan-binding domain